MLCLFSRHDFGRLPHLLSICFEFILIWFVVRSASLTEVHLFFSVPSHSHLFGSFLVIGCSSRYLKYVIRFCLLSCNWPLDYVDMQKPIQQTCLHRRSFGVVFFSLRNRDMKIVDKCILAVKIISHEFNFFCN